MATNFGVIRKRNEDGSLESFDELFARWKRESKKANIQKMVRERSEFVPKRIKRQRKAEAHLIAIGKAKLIRK